METKDFMERITKDYRIEKTIKPKGMSKKDEKERK